MDSIENKDDLKVEDIKSKTTNNDKKRKSSDSNSNLIDSNQILKKKSNSLNNSSSSASPSPSSHDNIDLKRRNDENDSIDQITNALTSFRDERDWKQFHNLKNLSLALSIEAAELNELFLWKRDDQIDSIDTVRLQEELADVFAYAFLFGKIIIVLFFVFVNNSILITKLYCLLLLVGANFNCFSKNFITIYILFLILLFLLLSLKIHSLSQFISITPVAERAGFDVKEIILSKIEKNKRKYPVEKAFGKSTKYNQL
jgi:NTP pyrophosphatase (non-canonical NTP hydrolase)